MKMIQHLTTDPTAIAPLIALLNSDNGLTRQRARETLVRIGAAAVPNLIALLADPHNRLPGKPPRP